MIKIFTPQTNEDRIKVAMYLERTGGKKGVDLASDVIHAAVDNNGDIVGVIAACPTVLVHELRVTGEMTKRHVAELLWAYASGALKSAGHQEVIITVDKTNTAMLRFCSDIGVQPYSEPDKDMTFLVHVK